MIAPTRRSYVWLGLGTAFLALMAAAAVLAGDAGMAVLAGAGMLAGILNIALLRSRGAVAGEVTGRTFRLMAIIGVLIALALVAWAALYAAAGQAEPAVVFAALACIPLVFARVAYMTARFMRDAVAAVAPEPVRAYCTEVYPLVPDPDARPAALVLTARRVARLQAADDGVTEVGSCAVGDIASMDMTLSKGTGDLVLHGGDRELSVRGAHAASVRSVFEALRESGVSARA